MTRQTEILNNLIAYVLELKEHETTEEKLSFFENVIGLSREECIEYGVIEGEESPTFATMQKYTVKKTYIYANKFIYNILGLDGENNDYIITDDNMDDLREYIENYIEEFGENEDLKKYLSLIEKELKNVDEVQVVRE